MKPPNFLDAVTVATALMVLAACGDEVSAPAAPQADASVTVLLEANQATSLGLGVEDALGRVIPSLDPSNELSDVATALTAVGDALLTRVPKDLAQAAETLQKKFDAFLKVQPDVSLQPDVASLQLLMADITAAASNPPLDTLRTK